MIIIVCIVNEGLEKTDHEVSFRESLLSNVTTYFVCRVNVHLKYGLDNKSDHYKLYWIQGYPTSSAWRAGFVIHPHKG